MKTKKVSIQIYFLWSVAISLIIILSFIVISKVKPEIKNPILSQSNKFLDLIEMIEVPGGYYIETNASYPLSLSSDPLNMRIVTTSTEIKVGSFFISKTEITNAQWLEVMKRFPSAGSIYSCSECPVGAMDWYEAVVFCNRLSELQGLTPCYYSNKDYTQIFGKSQSGDESWTISFPSFTTVYWNPSANGYRLPTSSEWEFAARGGPKSLGFNYAGSNSLEEVAWAGNIYGPSSKNQPQPVGLKKANELGLYDMSGNISEWCWNNQSSFQQIYRGGCALFFCDEDDCYVSAKSFREPWKSEWNIGFRIARN